ncbi:hypothetical protein QBC47DRAFT_216835 [Echria macrotheca]|uniref:Copper acquisition factor BIM1-like domain-containing protein n=1 Tax=Echria macrotheca TaxID=438768 RepID=A0AAJ0F496_9PEZI|nr:hypothetical protein QBC47DRAFT_216835 [Echria macrotheca]
MHLITILACILPLAQGHTILTYPPWRGNTLITNASFPFGMQWTYPCGGIGPTTNRTAWPLAGGGAVAFQPGWFAGHLQNLIYVNLCLGKEPTNCSTPMVPVFEMQGPSDNPYPGTICLKGVELPAGTKVEKGDMASIQVVQAQRHGGALYSCADIIFAEANDPSIPPVTDKNCFNSSDIKITSNIRFVGDTDSGSPPSSSPSLTSVTAPTGSSGATSTGNLPPVTSTTAGGTSDASSSSSLSQVGSAFLMLLHLL